MMKSNREIFGTPGASEPDIPILNRSIRAALDEHGKLLDRLRETLGVLDRRIESILRPEDAKMMVGSPEPGGLPPLASEIRGMSDNLHDIISILEGIVERIEL